MAPKKPPAQTTGLKQQSIASFFLAPAKRPAEASEPSRPEPKAQRTQENGGVASIAPDASRAGAAESTRDHSRAPAASEQPLRPGPDQAHSRGGGAAAGTPPASASPRNPRDKAEPQRSPEPAPGAVTLETPPLEEQPTAGSPAAGARGGAVSAAHREPAGAAPPAAEERGPASRAGAAAPAAGAAADDAMDTAGDREPGGGSESESEDGGRVAAAVSAAAGEPSAAPPPATADEYERERQERIRRNREMMARIGVLDAAESLASSARPAAQKPPRAKPRKAAAAAPPPRSIPTRSSARLRGGGAASDRPARAGAGAESEEEEEEPEPEVLFFDSNVRQYACEADGGAEARSASGFPRAEEVAEGSALSGFRQEPWTFSDPSLKRIYSIELQGSLLLAGGHEGRVALFSTGAGGAAGGAEEEHENETPLLSWKAHSGWIAGAQFLPAAASGGRTLLASAANDGTVALWDADVASGALPNRAPKRVAHAAGLHSSGIFSLHCVGTSLWTSSKDATCRESAVCPGGVAGGRVYDGHHCGVVKRVRVRDPASCVASGGNDGRVCIFDPRSAEGCVLAIERAHPTAVNMLDWHPSRADLLMTSGTDPAVRLFDLRRAEAPLFELRGHMGPGVSSCKGIYRPVFVAGGDAVVTCGEKSNSLTAFCTLTGKATSRGHIGFDASTAWSGAEKGSPLILAHGRVMRVFSPTFSPAAPAS